jgi:serine/threonine protein kinase
MDNKDTGKWQGQAIGRYHLMHVQDEASKWQDRMFGRYRLTRLIGRGGMGEVWQASDTHLGRQVAIKLLPTVMGRHRAYLDDFVNEAQTAAALEHPHILALHDFGQQEIDGKDIIPYLVMPYVPGGTLRQHMHATNGMLPVQSSLHFLRQAALAIDYAHTRQVLHRDIKPANMLLQQDWLLLSDFGIAKILSRVNERTHAGAGTPAYMAPERWQGAVEPASDRYSLAVIAYQLFTGHLPFQGETPYQTFMQQTEDSPIDPRQFNPNIPVEVVRALLQGLAKLPQQRPTSCIAFVDALQRGWLEAAPTQPDPDATLLAPWSKRWQEIPMQRSASLTPSQMPDIAPTYPSNSLTDQSTIRTRSDMTPLRSIGSLPAIQKVEQTLSHLSRRQLITGGIGAAVLLAGGATAATLLLSHSTGSARPAPPPPGPRKLIPGMPLLSLAGHSDEVWVAQWDPTGRYLVTAGNDKNVMLWDIASAVRTASPARPVKLTRPLRTWNIAGIKFQVGSSLCWSPDGRKLIAGFSFTNKAYVVDVFARSSTPEVYSDLVGENIGADVFFNAVCPGPLRDHFTVSSGHFAETWRFGQTQAPEKTLISDDKINLLLTQMAWSADGSKLAAVGTTSDDNLDVALWSNNNVNAHIVPLPQRSPHNTFFRLADTVAWSPVDPQRLLLGNSDIALVADLHKSEFILALKADTDANLPVIGGLSWSPNGRYIAGSYTVLGDSNAVYTFKPQIYIWDTVELLQKAPKNSKTVSLQRPTLTFGQQGPLQHTQSIISVQWSPDGRYLATPSLDHQVLIWQVDGG